MQNSIKLIPADTDYENNIRKKISGNHFLHFLGFEVHTIKPGYIEGSLDLKKHHLQQTDFVHGGVTATLCDIVSGFAAFTLVKKGQTVVTSDLKVSYLNPGFGNRIYASGWVIKPGSKMHFCESEVWMQKDNEKILLAKASTTMVVLNPEDFKKS